MFPFKWVREPKWRRQTGQVVVLELDPEVVLPAISVQPAWNRSQGIIRGRKEGDALIEDHICDVLDEKGRLVDISTTGGRIMGSEEMRSQVWTPEEHLATYRQSHPEEKVVAWMGNGNLLSNPHFVAFEASAGEKTLYHLSCEAPHLGRRRRSYSCLVVRNRRCKPRVSIEPVFFDNVEDTAQIYSFDERIITSEVQYATFGQVLVADGRPIDQTDIIRMAKQEQFYDLRHLFLFGRIDTGPDRWIDVGLANFWDTQGHMDTNAVERALRGAPIPLDARQFPADCARHAMDAKGYDETNDPKVEGQYALRDGLLRVVLRQGIYPHSMIGLRRDGRMIAVAIKGLSNRVGITIRGAADIMKTLGAENAILIDNGDDVMMSLENRVVLSSSDGRRKRLRSLLLFRAQHAAKPVEPQDVRVIEYPEEHAGNE